MDGYAPVCLRDDRSGHDFGHHVFHTVTYLAPLALKDLIGSDLDTRRAK
jgi:hypothetical protein